jgi:hypothetical protein
MRAGLLKEAATLLKIPEAALVADFEKMKGEQVAGNREHGLENGGNHPNANGQSSHAGVEDAAAPENNPPSNMEMALMEFLFGNGPDGKIADLLEKYAPDELFAHKLTREFVCAYVRETRGEADAILEQCKKFPDSERRWVENIFLSKNRAAYSELDPVENLKKDLCRFWAAAVRRRLGAMPVTGDADLERHRLQLSVLMRKLKSSAWNVARTFMLPSVLR